VKTCKGYLTAACMTACLLLPVSAQAGATFDAVKERGYVQCGLSGETPGFSMLDSAGLWRGLDVDICRAIAAAMFGDARKFQASALTSQQRFTALQSGEIDVLTRTATQTLTRYTTLGLIGVGAIDFYDSLGLLVANRLGVTAAAQLNGATVCVRPGTTTELNVADWARANSLTITPVVIERLDEGFRAFAAGRCDVYANDKSQLAALRVTMLDKPEDYRILPDDLSKEPLGPMVRQGDAQWLGVVRWTVNAMLEAEEYGITSQNVDAMLKSSNPNVQRILGVTPGMGKNLGLDDRWAYYIIKQVGHYGESFDANLGRHSPMQLPRGLNAQWRDGGLMVGWPIR